MNHVNQELYEGFDDVFEANPDLNDTEAHQTIQDLRDVEEGTIWDFAFLAIFIGFLIQMMIFAFASRNNVAFFWIFVIIGVIALVVGVMLSNIWQGIAEDAQFADTIARFPITDALLGSYFPLVIAAIIMLMLIVLFGKFPGQE